MKQQLIYQIEAMKIQLKVLNELKEEARERSYNAPDKLTRASADHAETFHSGSIATLEGTLKELERILAEA